MNIVIDTREQTPWAFPEGICSARRGTLAQGDYALEGDDEFAVERKNLNDFLGTISSGWERFKRELRRMDAGSFRVKVIIVEGEFAEFCFKPDGTPPEHDHPKLTPKFIASRIAELVYDFKCSVIFAGDPGHAAALAYKILERREKDLHNAD